MLLFDWRLHISIQSLDFELKTISYVMGIAEARDRGGVGNPRGLTMNVVPGPREGLVRPDPGSTPGRPAAV